jgi:uncharacterized protein
LADQRLRINPLDGKNFALLMLRMALKFIRWSIPALFLVAPLGATDTPAASFDFQPSPAIWKLADEDTEIYMFGTIHALSPELKWRSTHLNQIIENVDELVVETTGEDEADEAMSASLEAAMIAALDRKPLRDRVDPQNRATLDAVADDLKLSMDYLDLVPTWMVAFVLFYSDAEESGVSPEHGVETVLEAAFKKAKKPILAIEDASAVDQALNALSERDQLIALDELLTEIRTAPNASLLPTNDSKAEMFADDIAWAKGDVGSIGAELTSENMGDAYYRVLLTDRNAAWTKWLESRMQKPGKLLLAVGAAHLAGQHSVQSMLEKRGFTVKRIH